MKAVNKYKISDTEYKHCQRFCLGVELSLVEWKGYYQRREEWPLLTGVGKGVSSVSCDWMSGV